MKQNLKEVGKYKLEEMVGEGSYGKVYRGIDTSNGEVVALKFIKKQGKKVNELEGLKRQIQMLKKMSHRNIISMKDCMDTGKDLVIVMEYAETDLGKVMEKHKQKKKGLGYEEVKKIGRQMTDALLYLRQNRIVHRDLKLQNILIQNDTVKICDFGFAKMSGSTNFLNSFRGTPLYIAPQIIRNKPYNHKVDIWSFAIILFELYFGDPPFVALTWNHLYPKILNNKVVFPKDMPSQMRQLLDGMLKKNPAERYDWENIIDHPFFKQQHPLHSKDNVINQPVPLSPLMKKVQSEELKESKVLMKLEGQTEIAEIIKIESDLLANKICGKQLRTNIIFYHKIITILGVACTQENRIPKQTLLCIFKIITTLITKAKLDKNEADDDITKNNDIIFAIVKLAEKQDDFDVLAQQYMLLGYLLKNNFNNIQIDIQTQEEVIRILEDTLKKPNISQKVFVNCLKVLGILTSQATCTLLNSQDFFERLLDKKIIELITSQYNHSPQSAIILELLDKFVHPVILINCVCSTRVLLTFNKFKHLIIQNLLNCGLISQKSPIDIYTKSSDLQCYIHIAYEAVKISPKARQLFMKQDYWVDLFSKKNINIFLLAINSIIIIKEKASFLSKQFIQEIIQQNDAKLNQNKLSRVFLVQMAYTNISKKLSSKSKTEIVKAIINQIIDIFQTPQPIKIKSCKELQGSLTPHFSIFDDTLINIICDIIDEEITQREIILPLCEKIFQNFILFHEFQKRCNLSQQTMSRVLQTLDLFPNLSTNKKLLTTLNSIAIQTINQDFLQYLEVLYPKASLQKLICKYLVILRVTINTDDKSSLSILSGFEQNNLHRTLFSQFFMSEKTLPISLYFINKILISNKVQPSTTDFVAVQGLPKLVNFLNLKYSPIECVIDIVQLCSTLARISKQYYKAIEQFGLVQYFPQYLQSSETLQQKTLNLIGNLAKHSTQFFDIFIKHKVIQALQKCTLENRTSKRILKNSIYAVGNISYYDQRFYPIIQPLVGVYAQFFFSCEEVLQPNIISTISNLLRHSGAYLKSLIETGIIKKVFQLLFQSNAGNNKVQQLLSLLRKSLNYPQLLNDKQFIEPMRKVYEKRKILGAQSHDCIKRIKQIINYQ